MRVTAKVEYAVRATLELASQAAGPPRSADAIAGAAGIPLQFTENILADLRRAGIVRSRRGAEGGYALDRDPAELTVADIIRAVEGPLADVRGLRPEELEYQGSARALQDLWVAVRANLRAVLETVTFADLAANRLPSHVQRLVGEPDSWVSHTPGHGMPAGEPS